MASTITVTGLVRHHYSNTPWQPDDAVEWIFHGYSQTATEQRPSDRVRCPIAPDGTWSAHPWRNSEGNYQSYYTVVFPGMRLSEGLKVTIDSSVPDQIEFSALLLNSTPPSDSSYPSLIALIDERFASGNFTSSADLVPLNPAIPGLGTSVQSAITAQQANIDTLLNQEAPPLATLPDVDVSVGTGYLYRQSGGDFVLTEVFDGGNF